MVKCNGDKCFALCKTNNWLDAPSPPIEVFFMDRTVLLINKVTCIQRYIKRLRIIGVGVYKYMLYGNTSFIWYFKPFLTVLKRHHQPASDLNQLKYFLEVIHVEMPGELKLLSYQPKRFSRYVIGVPLSSNAVQERVRKRFTIRLDGGRRKAIQKRFVLKRSSK